MNEGKIDGRKLAGERRRRQNREKAEELLQGPAAIKGQFLPPMKPKRELSLGERISQTLNRGQPAAREAAHGLVKGPGYRVERAGTGMTRSLPRWANRQPLTRAASSLVRALRDARGALLFATWTSYSD